MAADKSAIAIRNARPSDLASAAALLTDASLPVDGLAARFGEGYVVAEQGGQLIGLEGVEVYGRFGLLRSAAVAAQHRGTGLGVRLTEDRIAWAKRRNLEALYLLTTTAAPFFAKLGFLAVPRASAPAEVQACGEFSIICASTAVCMRLDLAR